MTGDVWVTIRTIIRYAVYVGCAIVLLLPILMIVGFVLNPFSGFAGTSSFADKPGKSARRLIHAWPAGVEPANVKLVSSKHDYSIDSHSTWYKIELDAKSAQIWADAVHAARARHSLQSVGADDRGLEGVRRTVPGPPPLHWTTGHSPPWWNPPSIDFRATEAMRWYSGFDSGVGQAAYSGYDDETETLWIYEYACQHDRLWEPNQIPAGDVFSRLKEAEPGD